MRLLIVDNYDSFTYNLVDYVRRAAGTEPTVVPNDTPWAQLDLESFDAVIISPGPGRPEVPADVGISARVVEEFPGPILGVCLGFQLLVHAAGGTVTRAQRPAHGEIAHLDHSGEELFAGIAQGTEVVRYHSLVATDIPPSLQVTARCTDPHSGQSIAMGLSDGQRLFGVQFHPESLLSQDGQLLFDNFLDAVRRFYARRYFCVRTRPGADPAAVARGLERRGGNVFWLDSGQWSILGDDTAPGARHLVCQQEDPFALLAAEVAQHGLPTRVGSPIPGLDFALGWVGYLGYEAGSELMRGPEPDAQFIFATRAVVIDHAAGCTYLLSLAGDDAWELADAPVTPTQPWHSELRWVHDEPAYLDRIHRAQELMVAGESYEVCLTNRIELDRVPDPLGTFGDLRAANPSGRTGYLGFADVQLLSTTPELFVSVDQRRVVHSKPIKGTRPRGASASSDAALRAQLQGAKERSELLMVVDMVRHDLARVCTQVAVPEAFVVESFATVHQLLCHITGTLAPEYTAVDALRAAFPGGSMTGAPKRRTMEIIADLEGTWRGVYSGAFGYLSLVGTADFSMTIRSVVNTARGAYYGVGGAVLAVSDPQAEWEETVVKARPLTRYLEARP
ncbi:chorismate-binding protein [Corynebacterium lizhenjunii]|uniref:aminodeoxychorismate synthase n=1 Tax=Corynebacterium lizhenjunii TaxID=2709394 RepID=A0A7T0KFL6_9CORY|nr:chorismate-binding protein [Corynebacterium lizhenjunii]QPK79880.1 chorismate-binding protein [Corynebacterium lizhenjunii]